MGDSPGGLFAWDLWKCHPGLLNLPVNPHTAAARSFNRTFGRRSPFKYRAGLEIPTKRGDKQEAATLQAQMGLQGNAASQTRLADNHVRL